MTDTGEEAEEPQFSPFFGTILEPGSSFSPTFLLTVDGSFTALFVVLVTFAVLTRGNFHLVFLTLIELALWASVKWFVHEWNLAQSNHTPSLSESKSKAD
ncbi:hypothetical protein BJ322DRAFT_330125 [Thelephora terrestris]|uniref:Uncharacterized protein n=1 Tax=Thelephora terrestris TaxID=56493 RepID=A0A9P6H681_9AGAM|nr:hypothetical protein BJ322DRAFT_330125 [Thelephora terrestris]